MNFNWREFNSIDKNKLNNWQSFSETKEESVDPITQYVTSSGLLLGDVIETLTSSDVNPAQSLIAENNGNILGVVLYSKHNLSSKTITIIDLEAIVVNPQFAGQGIGTKIIEDVLQTKLFGKNIDEICALVDKRNLPSQRIFEKNGFSKTERTDHKYFEYTKQIDKNLKRENNDKKYRNI